MKSAIVILCCIVGVAVAGRLRREEKYTNKFDNVDVDQILKSDRLLSNYIKCLLDQGKCTADGSELKRILPDALETACSKCNDKQKTVSEKVIRFLIENKEDQFKLLEAKYDSNGVYRKKYEKEAKERGIKI